MLFLVALGAMAACGGGAQQANDPNAVDPKALGIDDNNAGGGASSPADDALVAGNCAKAKELANATLAKSAADGHAHWVLASCLDLEGQNESSPSAQKQKYADAIVHYKAAIAGAPHLMQAYISLCGLYASIEQFDDAIAVAQAGIGQLKKGEVLADLYANLGYAHFYHQPPHYAEAAESYRIALLGDATQVSWRVSRAKALLALDKADDAKRSSARPLRKPTNPSKRRAGVQRGRDRRGIEGHARRLRVHHRRQSRRRGRAQISGKRCSDGARSGARRPRGLPDAHQRFGRRVGRYPRSDEDRQHQR